MSYAASPVKRAAILDAMQGVLYENDRSVLRVTASKESDAGKPRTVVFVRLKEKSPA